MKLSKLLDVFKQKHLALDENTIERDFAFLREYLPFMFPIKSENDLRIARIAYGDSRVNNIYTDDFLPYFTRDNFWLAKELNNLIKHMQKMGKKYTKEKTKISIKHPKIPFQHVQKFIESDPEFDRERNLYEEDLVRAQIEFMMHDNEPNELLMQSTFNPFNQRTMVMPNFLPVLAQNHPDADIVFRKAVVDAMHKLGIAEFSIQAGLEKNAHLWRKQTMTNAYYNHFPLTAFGSNKNLTNVGCYDVAKTERENFKNVWLAQREYQYYQDHQDIINQLNCATPAMQMNQEKMQAVKQHLNLWQQRYQSYTKPNVTATTTQEK